MKKRFYLLCVGCAMILTSCGGHAINTSSQIAGVDGVAPAYSSGVNYKSMAYNDMGLTEEVSVEQSVNNEQKLIRRVNIQLELESNVGLESNVAKIQELTVGTGGYVADVSLDNRDSWANGSILAKVPKDKVDGFLEQIKELGIKVTSISDTSEDVTMQYTDTATRLDVKRTSLEKYRQYLEKAESVEELLSIESRIDSIVVDIESFEQQLKVLDNQIDYTEVTININCKTSINRDSFWVRAGQRLKSIGYEVGDTVLDAFEWMINAIIVIIFTAIPVILGVRVFLFAIRGKGRVHPIKWLKARLKKKGKEDAE